MAQPIPEQINHILASRTVIANSLARIRTYMDRSEIALPINITTSFETATNSLERILRHTNEMQNVYQQNITNITTERDQYQNILNEENRRVEDLRNQLHDARNQYANAYWGLRNNWQLAENRLAEINNVQRERDEFRRNAHRMTVRYNTDTERWRRRYGCVVRQAQNWKRQHRLQNQNFTQNINN